ncbi:MAG TPA: L,D-transpeptidase family protein [Pyrinomonadaceae bacterium]|nr:L,D-transpeptidase family protein [Pyrinomonadaceae bacterium]
MKRVSHALSFALVACLAAGCAPPTNTTTGGGTTNTAAPAPSPSPAAPEGPPAAAAEAQLPVTLPVLDAMFQDPAFAGELKTRLALTDEQVARLRRVAEEETTGLSEEGEGGSTAAAAKRATEKINETVGADKLPQFAALVRERWAGGEATAALPPTPNSVPTDTRVVVNAPAFRMDVFEDGRLVKTYRVGIGYPEFPLPQGLRKASQIIFNPTWTPPDEPWVKGKIRPGEKVEAGSKLNPLGPVKIPIGLPSLIHGGKSPARLGSFASHGCVGLTDKQVQDFSVILARLGGAEVTIEDVNAFAKNKSETKSVKLAREVPVELRYETIVVEDGKLHIFRDVYEKGTNTEENLRAVLAAHGVRLEDLSEPERAQVMEALQAMARGPQGNPVDPQATPTPTPTPDKKGKVRETRTVKGEKEAVIEIAALRGKGYPAPVNLDTGGAPQPKASPAPKKRAARA